MDDSDRELLALASDPVYVKRKVRRIYTNEDGTICESKDWELLEDPYDRILEMLRVVHMRPGLYVGSKDIVVGIEGFLTGMHTTTHLLGLDCPAWIWQRVASQRNWIVNDSLSRQMRAAGMEDGAIVKELLAMEIETWRQAKLVARNSESLGAAD